MKFLNKVVNFFNSITKRDLIFGIIIVLLIGSLSMSISRCSDINIQYKNNIAALQDTIHYYKDVNGNLVATKLAFESDLKTLKLLNKDLYDEIKDLSFEEALAGLENIVRELEGGRIKLQNIFIYNRETGCPDTEPAPSGKMFWQNGDALSA